MLVIRHGYCTDPLTFLRYIMENFEIAAGAKMLQELLLGSTQRQLCRDLEETREKDEEQRERSYEQRTTARSSVAAARERSFSDSMRTCALQERKPVAPAPQPAAQQAEPENPTQAATSRSEATPLAPSGFFNAAAVTAGGIAQLLGLGGSTGPVSQLLANPTTLTSTGSYTSARNAVSGVHESVETSIGLELATLMEVIEGVEGEGEGDSFGHVSRSSTDSSSSGMIIFALFLFWQIGSLKKKSRRHLLNRFLNGKEKEQGQPKQETNYSFHEALIAG